LDQAVNMAAQNSLYGRKTTDYLSQPMTAPAEIFVDVGDATCERRLVHHNDDGPLGFAGKRLFEPGDGGVIHIAVVLSRYRHIETNDPNRSMIVADKM
jgi:hypothetical protein